MIKLIAFDLDGTLLDEKGRICKEAKESICDCIRRGVKIGIVTGNGMSNMVQNFRWNGLSLGVPFPQFLILRERFIYFYKDSGYFPDRLWNQKRMAETEKLIRFILTNTQRWLETLEKGNLAPSYWKIEGDYGLDFLYTTIADAELSRKIMEKAVAKVNLACVWRNKEIVHIGLATAGKGRTLHYLADKLGIESKEILVIGDSLNDESMLDGKYGFFPGVVGNAEAKIKKIVKRVGGIVASKSYGKGVAEIIKKYEHFRR